MSYSSFSDVELCILLQKGEQRAMQEIVLRYWEPLYQISARTLEDLAACEDLVQNIFIKIWEGRESLNFTHSLKAYLFASVRYEVYRQVKLKLRMEDQLTPYYNQSRIERFNPQNKLEYDELMENVEKLVNELPERCRQIYQLSRNKQLSHKEISFKLGVTTKTVENQLTIALRKIRLGLSRILILLFF